MLVLRGVFVFCEVGGLWMGQRGKRIGWDGIGR